MIRRSEEREDAPTITTVLAFTYEYFHRHIIE